MNYGMLIVLSGDDTIREINLNTFQKEKISFGRNSDCDIVIDASIVSKIHGYFEVISGELCIYDNNSTNGIYINDVYYGADNTGDVSIYPLKEGDIIRIDNAGSDRTSQSGVIFLYTQHRQAGSWKEFHIDKKVSRICIGRSKDCDIRLNNVQVSRHHAIIEYRNGNFYIRDNKSANGTLINGSFISQQQKLNERDVIHIGPSTLLFTDKSVLYKANNGGARLVLQGVNKVVKTKNGPKKILNNANIQIEPNDFVAIIGGSGSGKTTIMNAMSAYERATSGNVYINSVDLYDHYNYLKNSIGYVPQQEIIYENLTLKRMLEYSAKLKMANDVSPAEIQKRIQEVLEMVELTEHQDKMIRSLSGGQKKRASIAVELLGDPGLFFLDEPTSGLDPGTEENLMRSLSQLSKKSNKTIIMVTHTTQNLHLCDKIILMGLDGNICFYGSAKECLKKFKVDSLTEVYNKVSDKQNVEKWSNDYYQNHGIHLRFHQISKGSIKPPPKENWFKQVKTLTSRYAELIINDKQLLTIMLLQPVLIGILIALVASSGVFENYNDTKSILFALSCAAIWVGLFNSIQEVCKERVILKREYMANLLLSAYILSKMIVQLVVGLVQSLLLTIVFTVTLGLPEEGIIFTNLPFVELFITLALTTYASAGIGIVISSLSKNTEQAMTAAPFILMIQLLFSGILFELSDLTEKLSIFTVSKWSVSSLGVTCNLNGLESLGGIPREFEDIFEFSSSNICQYWLIILAMAVICATVSTFLLRSIANDSR